MADLYRPYGEGLLSEEPTRFEDMYAPVATGLMFAPGSGVADVIGLAPSASAPGEMLPSMMSNIGSGQYVDAGLQGLGLLGDAIMAAGTVVPPLIPVGAAMKAPRAAKVASTADVFSEVADFPNLTKSEEMVVAASSAPPEQVAGLGRVVTEPIDPQNMAASKARFNELQKITSGYEQERAKARIVKLDDGTDAIQYMEPPATVQSVPISQLKATQPGLLSGGDAPLTEGPPLVVKKGGEFFVRDGHHRLARMIDAGADTADVRVVDLDAGGFVGADAPRAAKVASRMGEDVSDTLLMQQPKKRPKIRQMPQAEQDLYEAAAAFQLPREVGESLLLPRRAYEYGARTADVGSQGLLVDPGFQNLSRDIPDLSGTVVRDLDTLARSPDLDIQSLIGRTAKLMPGDMTMAGKEITHVQGIKLKNPVRMRGGKDFSAEDLSRELGLVWASNPSVISGYAKQARENPGLLGFYTAMGGRGGDFSHHVADVLVDMTGQAKKWIPESKIAEFNDEVKNLKVTREDPETGEKVTTTPFTDFPGITSPKLQKYMYSEGKGAARKAIADTMEKKSYRDSGFPDVTAVRMVVSDPQMSSRVNDPSGQLAPTGGRIVEFDADPMLPMAGQGNTPMFHKTYSQGISGTDLGGLSIPVPRILLAPDFFDTRRAAGKSPSSDRRSAEISNVLTVIRPEIADDVSVFQDYFNRGLLGKGL